MSLVPLLFSDWWEDLEQPHRIFDQNFGLGINPDTLMHPSVLERIMQRHRRFPSNYYRPWADMLRNNDEGQSQSGMSSIRTNKDKFQVILDVQQFKPEEINVKVVDNFVIIEGKHEQKKDEHGWVSRHFVRKYLIPEQCDIDQISSNLSSDGVLTITAPKNRKDGKTERTIKIEHTGKPAIQEKQRNDDEVKQG